MQKCECAACCNDNSQNCHSCNGSGHVRGNPPNEAGWWHVRYGWGPKVEFQWA